LEDNRGFEQGREQPIEPDEDQAISRAQPEPRWRRPLQDKKLMPEKRHLGLPSRMRSEHSDEQSAEQLQEVDPVAGTTCASMSGVRVGSDRTIDGRGASRCRQSKAFGRLGAVNWLSWTPVVHAVIDLSLPKTPEAAILAPQSTRNRGMAVHTERDCPQLQQSLEVGGLISPNHASCGISRRERPCTSDTYFR
jgi:hypothetical protein